MKTQEENKTLIDDIGELLQRAVEAESAFEETYSVGIVNAETGNVDKTITLVISCNKHFSLQS